MLIPGNWMYLNKQSLQSVGDKEVKKLCIYWNMKRQVIWNQLTKFKLYCKSKTNPATVPKTLAETVKYLNGIQTDICLGELYTFYCHALSAMNHTMWIEQWNSLAGLFTSGKKHERLVKSLSHKLNINVNAPALDNVDLREPAMEYTLEIAREGMIDDELSKLQRHFSGLFSDKRERPRKDERKKAAEFFGVAI